MHGEVICDYCLVCEVYECPHREPHEPNEFCDGKFYLCSRVEPKCKETSAEGC